MFTRICYDGDFCIGVSSAYKGGFLGKMPLRLQLKSLRKNEEKKLTQFKLDWEMDTNTIVLFENFYWSTSKIKNNWVPTIDTNPNDWTITFNTSFTLTGTSSCLEVGKCLLRPSGFCNPHVFMKMDDKSPLIHGQYLFLSKCDKNNPFQSFYLVPIQPSAFTPSESPIKPSESPIQPSESPIQPSKSPITFTPSESPIQPSTFTPSKSPITFMPSKSPTMELSQDFSFLFYLIIILALGSMGYLVYRLYRK